MRSRFSAQNYATTIPEVNSVLGRPSWRSAGRRSAVICLASGLCTHPVRRQVGVLPEKTDHSPPASPVCVPESPQDLTEGCRVVRLSVMSVRLRNVFSLIWSLIVDSYGVSKSYFVLILCNVVTVIVRVHCVKVKH